MKVRDLIQRLSELDPETPVFWMTVIGYEYEVSVKPMGPSEDVAVELYFGTYFDGSRYYERSPSSPDAKPIKAIVLSGDDR